ncbi:hypothetical protein SAMN02745196_01920 [Clostridium collagenovorans DSM 3089]|uniref:DUF5104 domain-containing protein n=1 Tax=Clostridium collagenovorans DSM 3089 TaxID=1121306 RepID=A0A1M5WWM8_9CLOT|nr:hypothetical protein [Clostridium collagenovorans]SHH91870.1 hypothetical protein SAMN02745196_01920 [Clostridium collagenovorans DSM 3089]
MRKLVSLFLSLCLVFSFMMGCGKKENVYEGFIKKLVDPETYKSIANREDYKEDIQKFIKDYGESYEKAFEGYLNKDGLDSLIRPAIASNYEETMRYKGITGVKDIKISDVKKDDKSDYDYVSCNVSYVYTTDSGESIDMKESLAFHINKKDKIIQNVWIDDKNSSIMKLAATIKR